MTQFTFLVLVATFASVNANAQSNLFNLSDQTQQVNPYATQATESIKHPPTTPDEVRAAQKKESAQRKKDAAYRDQLLNARRDQAEAEGNEKAAEFNKLTPAQKKAIRDQEAARSAYARTQPGVSAHDQEVNAAEKAKSPAECRKLYDPYKHDLEVNDTFTDGDKNTHHLIETKGRIPGAKLDKDPKHDPLAFDKNVGILAKDPAFKDSSISITDKFFNDDKTIPLGYFIQDVPYPKGTVKEVDVGGGKKQKVEATQNPYDALHYWHGIPMRATELAAHAAEIARSGDPVCSVSGLALGTPVGKAGDPFVPAFSYFHDADGELVPNNDFTKKNCIKGLEVTFLAGNDVTSQNSVSCSVEGKTSISTADVKKALGGAAKVNESLKERFNSTLSGVQNINIQEPHFLKSISNQLSRGYHYVVPTYGPKPASSGTGGVGSGNKAPQ